MGHIMMSSIHIYLYMYIHVSLSVHPQWGKRCREDREHQAAAEVSLCDESKLGSCSSIREDHQGGAGPRPEQVYRAINNFFLVNISYFAYVRTHKSLFPFGIFCVFAFKLAIFS